MPISFSSNAKADVLYKQKFKFFTVRGKTSRQIFRDFQKRGPIKATTANSATLGAASIGFSRKVQFEKTATSCKVAKATITAKVTIFLPKWANYQSADEATQKDWDVFLEKIRVHELTHGKIAKDYAGRIERKLMSFRPRSTCEKLETALTAAGERLLAKHENAQQRFDRKEYGRLLGR